MTKFELNDRPLTEAIYHMFSDLSFKMLSTESSVKSRVERVIWTELSFENLKDFNDNSFVAIILLKICCESNWNSLRVVHLLSDFHTNFAQHFQWRECASSQISQTLNFNFNPIVDTIFVNTILGAFVHILCHRYC